MAVFFEGQELFVDPETGNVTCSCGIQECEYHSSLYEVKESV